MNLGGAETMLMNAYRATDRRVLQFDFVSFSPTRGVYDEEIEALGGRVIRVPFGRLSRSTVPLRLWRLLRRDAGYAAVHVHVLHASGPLLMAAWAAGVPRRVAHSHNTGDRPSGPARRLFVAISRWMIRATATDLVACGRAAGDYLYGERVFAGRGRVVPNGVDVGRFQPCRRRDPLEVRRELGVSAGALLLGCVARFERVKNHELLLEIAAELKRRGADFKLLLVGDGSRRAFIATRIVELGLTGEVVLLGLRGDIPDLMGAVDVVLLPSHFEGLPVSIVEAQAAGTVCAVSEAVDPEVDLGLGLVRFLPIDTAAPWVDALLEDRPATPTAAAIQESLIAQHYDARSVASVFRTMYGVSDGTRRG
jgi:glycosyltransferase EpsF